MSTIKGSLTVVADIVANTAKGGNVKLSGDQIQTQAADTALTLAVNGTGSIIIDQVNVIDNIISPTVTNADLEVRGNGTGSVKISNAYTLPAADGTASYVLTTAGDGTTSWSSNGVGDVVGPASATSTAIVVYDGTTGKLIKDSSILIDGSSNITGVVGITATSFATDVADFGSNLSGITWAADGSETNIGLTLTPKGTGRISLDGVQWPAADGTADYILKTDGAGSTAWIANKVGDVVGPASATDTAVALYDGTTGKLIKDSSILVDGSSNVTGVVGLTATTVNATTFDTNVAAAAVTLAGTTLAADGTDANIDITITPKAAGNIVLDGIKFPNSDGSANQVMVTDGGGNLSFTDVTPTKYTVTDADTDTAWGSAGGGFYTRDITAATHGRGVSPLIQLFEYDGTNRDYVELDRIRVTHSNGDVELRVPETPDGRTRLYIIIL